MRKSENYMQNLVKFLLLSNDHNRNHTNERVIQKNYNILIPITILYLFVSKLFIINFYIISNI